MIIKTGDAQILEVVPAIEEEQQTKKAKNKMLGQALERAKDIVVQKPIDKRNGS
jgi:hypothetical protein